MLKIADFNITIFSTTAVEGPVLGAQTIFYNADGYARKNFNTEQMNMAVLEDGEKLSWDFLNNAPKAVSNYYIDDYFKNVKNTEIGI